MCSEAFKHELQKVFNILATNLMFYIIISIGKTKLSSLVDIDIL